MSKLFSILKNPSQKIKDLQQTIVCNKGHKKIYKVLKEKEMSSEFGQGKGLRKLS